MMRFTLRQLQVFTAIGQTGTVSAAALRLAMSQSAASTALAELERQIAAPLFDRLGKRLRLNELGRSLLPRAIELLDRAQEMERLLVGEAAAPPLRIGATLTIGNYVVPALLGAFRTRFAGAAVELVIDNTSRIAARVADFDLDLALIEGDISDPGLEVTDWLTDELAVFCGPDHPLAGAGPVAVERVLAEPWVVREPGSGTRQTLDRAMSAHWSRWTIALVLEQTEAIKTAVRAGLGIGCVSRLALSDAFASGSLVEVKVPDMVLARRFYIALHRQKYHTPGLKAFLDLAAGWRLPGG
jgi:DNA-binding transcriptional LysR family regulator